MKGDTAAVFTLVAVFFGANWQLLTGRLIERWDGADILAPFYVYLARMTRSGHFLLWNPFSSGGSPDFAMPDIGAFSPSMLLFGLIAGPSPEAFRCYWLCVWLFGGLGMYVLARALSAPPWGALLLGLSLVFSGFYLGHAQHLTVIHAFSFVPWILWRTRAAIITGRWWAACEAGALWGLSGLAGNPAIVIPAGLFTGLVALAWLPEATRLSWPARWRNYILTMLLLAAVGAVVLSPTYLSFRHEVVGFSDRGLPVSREVADPPDSLGWKWLASISNPIIALCTWQNPGWPSIDISYLLVYFGAAPPTLALFAWWRRRSEGSAWVYAGAGLLFLGFALGSTLPFRAWLYDLVPPTRFIRHPPMFRGFFMVATAMLAASGTRIVEDCVGRPGKSGEPLATLATFAGGLALLSVTAFVWTFSTLPELRVPRIYPSGACLEWIAWVGLAILCVAVARWPAARRWFPSVLVGLAVVDLTGAYLLTRFVACRPAVRFPHSAVLPLLDLGPEGFARAGRTYANNNLYIQKPVFASYTAMSNIYFSQWGENPLLLASVAGPDRVWFAAAAPVIPITPETFSAFQSRVAAVGGLVILRHERADLLRPPPTRTAAGVVDTIAATPRALSVPCRVLTYRANELALSVTCPEAGYLLLTDRWSRSWTATVNGRPVTVDGGDFLFRLTPVTAGENQVVMNFRPPWLFPLLILSWTTLATVGAGSWWLYGRTRNPSRKVAADPGPGAAATIASPRVAESSSGARL